MVDKVVQLDFVTDRDTADAACREIWRSVAESVEESVAVEVAAELPEDLLERELTSQRPAEFTLSRAELMNRIVGRFNLQPDDALRLIETVLHAGEEMLGDDSRTKLKLAVPQDVAGLM